MGCRPRAGPPDLGDRFGTERTDAISLKAGDAMRTLWKVCLLVLFCAVSLISCASGHEYNYQRPEQTGDGWQTASLADVGIDPEPINDLMDRIHRKEYENVHGILIVKNGKLKQKVSCN